MSRRLLGPRAIGLAREFDGLGTYLRGPSSRWAGYPLTLSAWFRTNNVTANQTIFGLFSGADQSALYMDCQGATAGDPLAAVSYSDTGGFSTGTINGITANAWHHGAAVFTGSTSRTAWLNGVSGTANTTSRVVTPSTLSRTTIGVLDRATIGGYFDGAIDRAAVYAAALSASEIKALASGAHPLAVRPDVLLECWDVDGVGPIRGLVRGLILEPNSAVQSLRSGPSLQQRRRRGRVFVARPSAADAYVLTADLVSYGATASAATLRLARRVDAQPVASAWAPTAATLAAARRLSAASVAYGATATAATLLRAFRLAVDSVAYASSATAASVRYARRLTADSVPYAWTPSAATLVSVGDYDLVANPVAYGATPTAATLTVARRLVCAPVAFAATPTTASLRAARGVQAASVTYTWAPTPATLGAGVRFQADSVAYVGTASSATLRSARLVSASSVASAWAPTGAGLTYSGEVPIPAYGVLRVSGWRASAARLLARASRGSLSARTHLSES